MATSRKKQTVFQNQPTCDRCAKVLVGHDTVQCTFEDEPQQLCTQCFNAEIARRSGIDDFDNNELDPISIKGADGVAHEFHFQTRLLGGILSLEAFEMKDGAPGGYQFQLIAEPEEERFAQLARMVQRIRSTLAIQFLEDSRLGLQIKDREVLGRIEMDSSEDAELFGERVPMMVIDGKDVSWEEFGRMLMSFEGWQFKLQMVDPSDDPLN